MGLLNRLEGLMDAIKPERNEPCRCGSGKKYKNCHLIEDEKKKALERLHEIQCGPA
jgi:uncharacterized protein YecA (UPF0149 family)